VAAGAPLLKRPTFLAAVCMLNVFSLFPVVQVFTAISDELRAKSNVEMAKSGIHK
jgi:hypothetical protein